MPSDNKSQGLLAQRIKSELGESRNHVSLEQQTLALEQWVENRRKSNLFISKARLNIAAAAAVLIIGAGIAYYLSSIESFVRVSIDGAPHSNSTGAWVNAPEDRSIPVLFENGSELNLLPKSSMRIMDSNKKEISIELHEGRLAANIQNGGNAKWSFHAGPYKIEIKGTSFDLIWDKQNSKFELIMRRGSVLVKGAGIDEHGMRVSGVDRLVANPSTGSIALNPVVEDAVASETKQGEVSELESLEETDYETGDIADIPSSSSDKTPGKTASTAEKDSWIELFEQGKYLEALLAAQEGDFDAMIGSVNAQDLWRLGEVARVSGNHRVALQVLETYRTRFKNSNRASTSAFLIGRIYMDNLGNNPKATHYFRAYLADSPAGPLSEEAAGRIIVALNKGGSFDAASKAARRYLDLYPNGSYSDVARSVLLNTTE